MKDEQRVYIKGNPKRGAEIIKTLTDLGGKNTYRYNGEDDNIYYYIAPNGVIKVVASTYEVFPFIEEFYKEVKLPKWKPRYKEHYYRINWQGAIVDDIWHDTQDEEICYEFGNCFKTYEEAKEASRKIEEMLNQ